VISLKQVLRAAVERCATSLHPSVFLELDKFGVPQPEQGELKALVESTQETIVVTPLQEELVAPLSPTLSRSLGQDQSSGLLLLPPGLMRGYISAPSRSAAQ
jgi:hypothetical protein